MDQGSDDVPNLCWVDAAVRKVELLDLAAVGVAEGLDVGLAIAHAASRAAVASRIVSVRQCGVEGGGHANTQCREERGDRREEMRAY